jgi:hypothetical protein
MFANETTSPESRPCYCPGCGLKTAEASSAGLCPECGDSLVAQGFCPVCEGYWTLAEGALCPKHEIALEVGPGARREPVSAGECISWTTVQVFPDSLAAAVPRSRLEAEGIPTFLDGERAGGSGAYGAPTVGVKLQVPAKHVADARVILSQNWSLPSDEKADFDDLL